MHRFLISAVALSLSLVALGTSSQAEGKKNGFVEDPTVYLGNSDNEAAPGQGGQGTRTETTTGPKGQVINQDNSDCNNCTEETTDRPGASK